MPIKPDAEDFAKDFHINVMSLLEMMIMDILTIRPAHIEIERELDAEYMSQMEQVKEVKQ